MKNRFRLAQQVTILLLLSFNFAALGQTPAAGATAATAAKPASGSCAGSYDTKTGKCDGTYTTGGDTATTSKSGCSSTTNTKDASAACETAYAACNSITAQQSALISQALNQAKSSIGTTTTTDAVAMDKSAATSCKIGAGMAAIAGAGTLALAVTCESKTSSCKSKVKATQALVKADSKNVPPKYTDEDSSALSSDAAVCSGLDGNWQMDGLQALSYAASAMQNYECAKYYDAAAADALPKTCAEEPTRADCICVINPNDPSCLGQNGGLATTGFSDSSVRGSTASADDGLGDLGASAVQGSGGTAGAGLPGASAGGGGGPSLLGGKASPDQADAPGAGPYNTNVISGTTSGGGGNPYARGGSGEGEGNNNSLLAALANKLNLKKYLPGNRGLASTGRDGLTGANGPSIWDKVSTQYGRKKGEMVP